MNLSVKIRKRFGAFSLSVSFSAEDGVLGLLGASGCGKSLTLRCIAGIETPDEGRIVLGDRVLFDSEARINLAPQKRRVGYLFQQYALFPTMTVEKNIEAGALHLPRADRRKAVGDMMERMQISDLRGKLPAQLSGGQQQRAALARILINGPEVLLLDEPFSALDAHLRDRMEQEVMGVVRAFGGVTVLVSHSRDEIYRMADRIAVYDQGHIEVLDEKHRLFQNPRTTAAAILTGCKNLSRVSGLRKEAGRTMFQAEDWGLELAAGPDFDGTWVGLRRHYLRPAAGPGPNTFEMEISEVIEDPFEYVLLLRRPGFPGAPIQWALPREAAGRPPSGTVYLTFPEEALMPLRDGPLHS